MKTLKAIAANKHSDQDHRGLRVLNAKLVCLSGDSAAIGALGKFLSQCAEEMKNERPFHRHFRDFRRDWDATMADIVVERAAPKPKTKKNA